MSRRKAALATFAGSGSTTVIAAAQSILLLPLYLRTVGTEAYGIWLATGEILLWMVAFDCGIPNLMIQRIGASHAQGRTQDIGRHFMTCVSILGLTAIVLASLVWSLSPFVVQMFAQGRSVPPNVIDALRLAAAATGLVLLNYSFQGLARALQQTLWPNVAAVISTLAAFATTYTLLLQGYGLEAIAIGLVVRSGGSLVGNILAYLLLDGFKDARQGCVPSLSVARDYLRETPLLLTSGIAYALMNNSQIAVANLTLGPGAAVLLSVTRKIAEFIKAVLDMVSYATEGGFAHLFATGDRLRAARVLREIDERFYMIGVVMLGGYLAINGSFVSLWTEGAFQPGPALTTWMAVGTMATAWSYLGIARLRATGAFRVASSLLLADCACRILLMVAGSILFGVPGLCAGAALPPIGFGFWARRKLDREMGAIPRFDPTIATLCVGLLVISAAIGLLTKPANWMAVLSLGLTVSAASAGILFLAARRPRLPVADPMRRAA